MAYEAPISRANPSCIVFLVDQSESMEDPLCCDSEVQKKDGVAGVVNRFLHSLIIRCTMGRGEVLPYYYVSVIGYGETVGPAFVGEYQGVESICVSDLASACRIDTKVIETEEGTETIRSKVWFDPVSDGLTPMCEGLEHARRICQTFVDQYPNCNPPMVINITDGDSTDGSPTKAAELVKQVRSTDGNVLLFNVHVSTSEGDSIIFPNTESVLSDPYARMLFRMSSVIPLKMRQISKELRFTIADGARGFAFNADLTCLTSLIEIGTRSNANVKA